MSNDLLNLKWEKRPRTNYVAIASNNKMALRSSHRDMYSYASVCINHENDKDYQFTYWASFHSTKELADRQTKAGNKNCKEQGYVFETIQLKKLDNKEYKKLCKARLKETKAKREIWYQELQAKHAEATKELVTELISNMETELENVSN